MKQPYLKKLSARLCVALALIGIGLIIHSCRKDIRTGILQTTLNTDDISELQAIYNKGIVTGSEGRNLAAHTVSGTGFPNFIRNLNVKWDKYKINNRSDNSQVTEFDMQPDSGLVTNKPLALGDSVFFSNRTSVVFIKLSDGTRINCFMKVIEDFTQTHKSVINSLHYRQIPAGFTGLVIFYTLDRKFINGNRYKNGVLTAVLGVPSASTTLSKSLTQRSLVAQDPIEGDCGGVTIDYFYYDCGWYISENIFYSYCSIYITGVIPDNPCAVAPTDGVHGDPTNQGGTPPPPPPPTIADSLAKIIKNYCDGVSAADQQQIKDALTTFKNENCVQSGIFTYIYKTFSITFCTSSANSLGGNGIAGGSNVGTSTITFFSDGQSNTISTTMDEELFHQYQNKVYPGGTNQYGTATKPQSDMEFEAAMFLDVLNPGATYAMLNTTSQNDLQDYKNWLAAITQNKTYYPKSINDMAWINSSGQSFSGQAAYNHFLDIYYTINSGRLTAPLYLAPTGILTSFTQYGCK